MDSLFLIISIISFGFLIVGLISPSALNSIFKKGITRKNVALIFGGVMIASFVLFGITSESTEREATELKPTTQQDEVVEEEETQQESTPEPEKTIESTEETTTGITLESGSTPETTSETTPEPETTLGEKNALRTALDYLSYASFSYSGLVKQLEFEGYIHEEAVYGADNCAADWNEQAALKAEEYLGYSAFSRDGLITQLEYEGFTRQQAEYGAQIVGY